MFAPLATRRRRIASAAIAVAIAAALTAASVGVADARPLSTSSSPSENDQIGALYQAALKEGGDLTVYAGGDTPTQQDQIKQAFAATFPGITLHLVVDLSKVQDARVDSQIDAKKVVADVVELQTLDDFPRWKSEGALLKYEPVGYDKVSPQFKDRSGYYTGVVVLAFANVTATALGSSAPVEAQDFLKPEFKDKLVFTYPNDDDAVLYYFKQLVDAYGWGYLDRLMAQNPKFVRGTAESATEVYDGQYQASFGTFGSLQPIPGALAQVTLPAKSPFVTWAQTAAILKKAPHPAAAKLYISWLLSKGFQQASGTFSPRTDVAAPAGYKPLFSYKNTDPTGLAKFLSDRAAVDRFKARIQLYVGDVTGPSPTGVLGFTPGAF